MVVNSHGGASNSLKKLNSEKFRKKAAKVDKDGLVLLISRAESLFGFIKGRAGVEQVKIAPKSELKEKKFGLVCQLLAEPSQIFSYNSLSGFSCNSIIHDQCLQ